MIIKIYFNRSVRSYGKFHDSFHIIIKFNPLFHVFCLLLNKKYGITKVSDVEKLVVSTGS